MPYNIDIPASRGFQKQSILAQTANLPVTTQYIRDLIIHALIFRISYNDNKNIEFDTSFVDDVLELDIAQDDLNKLIDTVGFGPKLDDFRRWLFSPQSTHTNVSTDFVATAATQNRTILICDASSGNISIDITDLRDGYEIIIKKIDNTINGIIFLNVIDGDDAFRIQKQYESITIVKANNAYYII